MFQEILIIFLSAMAPISEIRGAIPLGILVYDFPIWLVFIVAIIGNLIPVVLILWYLETVSNFLREKSCFFEKFFSWLFEYTRKKHSKKVEKYAVWTLLPFVAIPLPFTGAWSGALIAFVFGIEKKKALVIISLGVLMAGIIIAFLVLGGKSLI